MTKKKPKASAQPNIQPAGLNGSPVASDQPSFPAASGTQKSLDGKPTQERKVPHTLLISRNKHWRHISCYHGPWLNLPPEVLESLAYSNFYSPRPQPIDPAVFFDLVKIRRLIDDATSLAVRAANGTTSAALHSSLNAANGIFNGADAEILGIGASRGGGNAKLSRERKHRMREHATQKLSHAYLLDEIAASVATMQSASALEEVAKHVLQRSEQNGDALYVHFFHEKIPSMALADHTTLDPLNSVIRQKATEAAPYRTRAITRIFKNDFEGAARDCTEGLAVYRLYQQQQHPNDQRDLVLAKDVEKFSRDHRSDARVDEKDQPSSLEPQFYFYRGGAYLTLACENIGRSLYGVRRKGKETKETSVQEDIAVSLMTDDDQEDAKYRAEGRKLVRTYAKRALRDYTSFLSHFDYTPGLSAEYTNAFLEKMSSATVGRGSRSERLLDIDAHSRTGLSEAIVKYEAQKDRENSSEFPQIPKPAVHKLNTLFAAVPPSDLPPFPADPSTRTDLSHPVFSLPDFSEAVTYHPLLTDVLHSLLLCHCLIQTSPKEHLRHAYMAARIARVCDGYPIFLAARSPSRADWIEVVSRSKNWLGLCSSWETLCAPAPLPGQQPRKETEEEKTERLRTGAFKEALLDEKVMDEDSFKTSFKEQELRAARREEEAASKEYYRTKLIDDEMNTKISGNDDNRASRQPKRWAQEEGKGYPVTTERAEAIARWIIYAPPPSSSDGSGRPKKKTGAKSKSRKTTSTISSLKTTGLEESVDSLDLVD